MKRLILLTAIYLAAATGLSLRAANHTPEPGLQDTITIKLPDGVGLKVFVKNTDQLKTLKNYKLDSLMALLGRYVEQVEAMEKANKDRGDKEITVTFNPAKDLNDPDAPEQVSITISANTVEKMQQNKVEKVMDVLVELKDKDKHSQDTVQVKKASRKDRADFSFDVDLGLNTFVNVPANSGDTYDLRPWGSRYISLNQHLDARIGGQRSPFYLTTGLELAFNNYMLDNNRYFADVEGVTQFNKEPDELRSFEKSKLATSSLHVPLMATLKFRDKKGKHTFKFAAGGFAGYRLGSHTKLKYQQEGNTVKDKDRGNYNLEDFQYGLNCMIGYKGLEFFGKYNLNDLFKDKRGPAMNVVTFGLRL